MDANPPQINDTNLITGKKEKRDMTFEETYDYDRAVLRGIKRQMTSDLEKFKAATPKEASNYLDAVSTYYKAEVLKRMDLAANSRANPTEFEDFRKVPVNKNFSSTLTPEYDRVLKINAESAGGCGFMDGPLSQAIHRCDDYIGDPIAGSYCHEQNTSMNTATTKPQESRPR